MKKETRRFSFRFFFCLVCFWFLCGCEWKGKKREKEDRERICLQLQLFDCYLTSSLSNKSHLKAAVRALYQKTTCSCGTRLCSDQTRHRGKVACSLFASSLAMVILRNHQGLDLPPRSTTPTFTATALCAWTSYKISGPLATTSARSLRQYKACFAILTRQVQQTLKRHSSTRTIDKATTKKLEDALNEAWRATEQSFPPPPPPTLFVSCG